MSKQLQGIAPIHHLGVIRVQGDDAAKFLHGQLTQDFSLLGLSEARLAALCSPKGRMLASFIGFKRDPSDVLLVCSTDLLGPTLKRLSMFVMRAKARLYDASAEFSLFGLAGNATYVIANLPDKPWAKGDFDGASVVRLYPAGEVPRALWVAPVGVAKPQGESLSRQDWLWSEVASGVVTLSAAVAEAFVPQMLNYESVGGINFKKGCYPGQEVVARSQFRGSIKRRAQLMHAEVPMPVGIQVFHDSDPEQACGIVAQSAAAPSGGFDAIVSVQISALESGQLHLASVSGAPLHVLDLPYPLLQDL